MPLIYNKYNRRDTGTSRSPITTSRATVTENSNRISIYSIIVTASYSRNSERYTSLIKIMPSQILSRRGQGRSAVEACKKCTRGMRSVCTEYARV